MRRLCEILRALFNFAFWRDFAENDVREESRMLHEYESLVTLDSITIVVPVKNEEKNLPECLENLHGF